MANALIPLLTISCCLALASVAPAQNDTLKPGNFLRDYEQLISAGGRFRLGFFSTSTESSRALGSAGPRYLGIWRYDGSFPLYYAWVGNREKPVPDSSGTLAIDEYGRLKISYQGGPPIFLNNSTMPPFAARNSSGGGRITATLLDTGNLVVRQLSTNGTTGRILWQSFDYPHNVLLPGMKLGMNLKTGQNWTLTSWLSDTVPAPGAFRLGLDPSGANQMLVWRRDEIYWSSGEWKNGSFQSAPVLTLFKDIYDFRFVATEEERYFTYSIKEKVNVLSKWDLDTLGVITVLTQNRIGTNNSWTFESTSPCFYDRYNYSAVCLTEKPSKCRNNSQGFVPKRGYLDYSGSLGYSFGASLAPSDCHAQCWGNCSCGAYSSASSSDGTTCEFWKAGTKFTPDDNFGFVYLLTDLGRTTATKILLDLNTEPTDNMEPEMMLEEEDFLNSNEYDGATNNIDFIVVK
ncbi:hypothetical protein Tsubulata_005904 [Turnera subulata]|uniref:Bulb-type lectin domain-containing protein n=1 Tax=Turnera subulata TaxID=218843 RepID=A0A9Q0G3W5_9ROSI|nr:hypothetical protein Tsubulata_005904 [Turnera subulata]